MRNWVLLFLIILVYATFGSVPSDAPVKCYQTNWGIYKKMGNNWGYLYTPKLGLVVRSDLGRKKDWVRIECPVIKVKKTHTANRP